MSRLIFDASTLGGTTTLSSEDAVGNFTIDVPAATGTMSVKDASGDATFRNITLTGAVLAGAWNGSTITVPYGGTGAVTLTGYVKGTGTAALTASATIPNTDITGLGTMSTQNASAVAITGGTIDGVPLGGTTPAAATVTTLRINSTLSLAGTTGTAAQVLTSNGASPPTWQSIAGTGTVISINGSGGTTGLTLTGGPITVSGTLTLGGTLIAVNGGTGQSSYVVGDVLYASTTTALSKLTIGTTGQVLTVAAGIPSWATPTTGTVTSVTGTAPVVSSGGNTPAISMAAATTSVNGYLTSTDWNTFNGKGSVTSVSFTGGVVSVATATTTPALTIAGTSGGVPYFSSATTWATSAVLAASALVIGGGAGAAPSTITTGTGVVTALGVNVGSAGALITFNGALGTPSSGTVTNLTGTASININGTVGATTPGTGAFTTLSASSTVSGTGFTTYFASPPALGTTAPAEVKVTVGWAANTALTDAATVAWDTTNQVATFTFVSSNRTMGAPTNLKNGAFYALAVIQNAGSNTLTWNSVFKWASGTAPTLSTAASAKDYFTFRSDGTNLYQQGISQAVA